jgi:phosphomannomutase
MRKILLFDVDGTLCDSGKKISQQMANILNKFVELDIKIGIVGGGTFEKILFQLDNLVKPEYIFSECGSVYHQLDKSDNKYHLVGKKNLRTEPEYIKINQLIKTALEFISKVDYLISGNFIDLRNGLIYISLVGMAGTDEERENFIKLDKINNYRNKLIGILEKQAKQLDLDDYLDICLGGSVGIALNPKKWNKIQVLNLLNLNDSSDLSNSQIHFFGDKYLPGGNDYELISSPLVIPHPVDSPDDTFNHLSLLLKKMDF